MENMRVFKDGNRLVIVMEAPSFDLEDMVKSMLTGSIQTVEHLAPPPPMQAPEVKMDSMENAFSEGKDEGKKLPKFLEKARQTEYVGSGHKPHETAGNNQEPTNLDTSHEKNMEKDSGKEWIPNDKENTSVVSYKNIKCMNVFLLREFLRRRRGNEALENYLWNRYHTRNLEFALQVKPEAELREMAMATI